VYDKNNTCLTMHITNDNDSYFIYYYVDCSYGVSLYVNHSF